MKVAHLLPLNLTAIALNISVSTLRREVQAGRVPQARRGRRGRGGAALFDVDVVRALREGRTADALAADLPDLVASVAWSHFCTISGPHKRACAGELAALAHRLIWAIHDRLGVLNPQSEPELLRRLRQIL